jgi:hypothetical protein
MDNFYEQLIKIFPDECVKEHNLILYDPIFTRAINGMTPQPVPNIKTLEKYRIDYLIIFDTEFYTINDPDNDLKEKLGFIVKGENTNTVYFVRECSLLILERNYDIEFKIAEWTIKAFIDLDFDSSEIYKKVHNLRELGFENLSFQILGRDFLTVSDNFDKNFEKNLKYKNNEILTKGDFINRLKNKTGKELTEKNYYKYSYFPYLKNDKELVTYYDTIKNTYVNDELVKERMLNKDQSKNFLNLLNKYKNKISYLYKGENDLIAFNNTFKIFNNYIGKKYIDKVMYFENKYDMIYFNGMSHVLFDSAQLKKTCDGIFLSNFFKRLYKIKKKDNIYSETYKIFYLFIYGVVIKGQEHNPNFDTLCTFLTVLVINIAIYMIFNKNTIQSNEFIDLYINLSNQKGEIIEKTYKLKKD